MRYGSYTCVYLRSSALECIHAFKIRIFFVYTVHDMMCLTSYSKTACMTAQNRKYFPKILMSFSTTAGSRVSCLAGQYVCVGVYQWGHEESHGRETTGTILGNNNYSIPHHSLVQGCESVDQHMNVHTLWANLSKTTWQHTLFMSYYKPLYRAVYMWPSPSLPQLLQPLQQKNRRLISSVASSVCVHCWSSFGKIAHKVCTFMCWSTDSQPCTSEWCGIL